MTGTMERGLRRAIGLKTVDIALTKKPAVTDRKKGPPSFPMAGLSFFFGLREARRPY
jgi:hypothetical protein